MTESAADEIIDRQFKAYLYAVPGKERLCAMAITPELVPPRIWVCQPVAAGIQTSVTVRKLEAVMSGR